MTEKLESAIVRICTKNKKYVGVGVLVSDKHVLTCAHVVADALPPRSRTQQDQPNEPIYLDFPFVAPGQLLSAKVVFWRPILPDLSVLPETGEDIAGLELDELPPLLTHPILLYKSAQASELEDHQFDVFGIPAGNPQGSWADGFILKRLANGWVQIEDKEQGGFQIEPGFSGSPIWDRQLKAVVGITVATDPKRPQAKVGFMIPNGILLKAWSELETINLTQFTKRSDLGVDYTDLANLLRISKWKKADEFTVNIMLKIANQEEDFDSESLHLFPYSELLIIDKLWSTYSNGRFGFSVQKHIFHKLDKDVKKFGERVGWGERLDKNLFKDKFFWRDQDKLKAKLNSPLSHLPVGHLPLSWASLNNQFDGITEGSKRRIKALLLREDLRISCEVTDEVV